MTWMTPQFSRKRVDSAGDLLVSGTIWTVEIDDAFAVINNWRSSHSYALHCLKMNLRQRTERMDQKAVIAQRLKRLSSIAFKLKRNTNMKLSQMQDIGGCRAVVETARDVDRIVRSYDLSIARNAKTSHDFVRKYDYIRSPKNDGYRGVHFVYKYRSSKSKYEVYNGLRIEVQIRSRLQHAWATAVETVSAFTGQALKSNIGTDSWKRFFALMGSAIAIREGRYLVPGAPVNHGELVRELRVLSDELKIEDVLAGWSAAVKILAPNGANASAFLLVLDQNARTIQVTGFGQKELERASEEYLKVEKENTDSRMVQAVLVSVASLDALRSAYPNYYLDTTAFLNAVRQAIE
jgi:ppGpp synthetase/RelA/SpoT-type nucleotidyltranferase